MGLVHNETERWAATCFFGCFSEAYDTGAFGRARVAGVRGRAKMIPVDWKLSGEIISLLLALSFKSVWRDVILILSGSCSLPATFKSDVNESMN